jgi:hypothetical protein
VNVRKGVGLEQYEVSEFAWSYRTILFACIHEERRIAGRRLQRSEGCDSRLNEMASSS